MSPAGDWDKGGGDVWVFTVLLFKLFWSFDIFQNNKLGEVKIK